MIILIVLIFFYSYKRLLELKELYLRQVTSNSSVKKANQSNSSNTTPIKKSNGPTELKAKSLTSPRNTRSPSTNFLKSKQISEEQNNVYFEEDSLTPRRKKRKSLSQVLKNEIVPNSSSYPKELKNHKQRKKENFAMDNESKSKFVKLTPINFDIFPDLDTECCQCGATSTETWYLGPEIDKWRCKSCGEDWSRCNACPICGLVYEEDNANHFDNDYDEESVEDETDSWIECDKCGRWVMTKCGGIKDLSLYDDNNPDHLPYECPFCVGKMENLPRVFYRKNNAKVFEKFVNEKLREKEKSEVEEEKGDVATRKLLSKEKEIFEDEMIETEDVSKECESFRDYLSETWKSILTNYHKQYESQLELLRKEKNDFELRIEREVMSDYEKYVKTRIQALKTDK